jgi:uncharacterized membrane protein required for colicin V production
MESQTPVESVVMDYHRYLRALGRTSIVTAVAVALVFAGPTSRHNITVIQNSEAYAAATATPIVFSVSVTLTVFVFAPILIAVLSDLFRDHRE